MEAAPPQAGHWAGMGKVRLTGWAQKVRCRRSHMALKATSHPGFILRAFGGLLEGF